MMGKPFQILVCLSFCALFSFGQGADSLFVKKGWAIEGGINALIPFRQYDEKFGFDCFDCVAGEYSVNPSITIANFFLSAGYYSKKYPIRNSFIQKKITIGYLHQERQNIKRGSHGGGWGQEYFNGKIQNITTDEYVFARIGLCHSMKLINRLLIVSQLTFDTYLSFIHSETHKKYGTVNEEWSYNSGVLELPLLSSGFSFQFGLKYALFGKLGINPKIEIPIFFIDSSISSKWNKNYYESPYSGTSYFTSINNMSLLSIGIVFSYQLNYK